MKSNDDTRHEAQPSGAPARRGAAYGLPANETLAVERFFTELRKHGRLRLACAAAGWTRAKMEIWRQPWNVDGTKNARHNADFALAVEQAICQFQGELFDGLFDKGEDVDPGFRRATAWALERLFTAEFPRANSPSRPAKPAR